MIKFKTTPGKDGKAMIGLGLSFKNLRYLAEGKPIKIDGDQLGIDFDLFIFSDINEDRMFRKIQEIGLIDKETRLHGADDEYAD